MQDLKFEGIVYQRGQYIIMKGDGQIISNDGSCIEAIRKGKSTISNNTVSLYSGWCNRYYRIHCNNIFIVTVIVKPKWMPSTNGYAIYDSMNLLIKLCSNNEITSLQARRLWNIIESMRTGKIKEDIYNKIIANLDAYDQTKSIIYKYNALIISRKVCTNDPNELGGLYSILQKARHHTEYFRLADLLLQYLTGHSLTIPLLHLITSPKLHSTIQWNDLYQALTLRHIMNPNDHRLYSMLAYYFKHADTTIEYIKDLIISPNDLPMILITGNYNPIRFRQRKRRYFQ